MLRSVGTGIAVFLLAASSALATNLWTPVQTCTGADCGATLIRGSVTNGLGDENMPWAAQVYAPANTCLRLRVISQVKATGGSVDLEMTVVSPNGVVWRNDDSAISPCGACSLLKIKTIRTGWHTVQISEFAGTPGNYDFELKMGVYSSVNNANCSNPSIGFSPADSKSSPKAGLSNVAGPSRRQ